MPLRLDVQGNDIQIWVEDCERWREANVVYALNFMPWWENRITHYVVKWYDLYLLQHGLTQLGFQLSVTERFNQKWQEWHRHLFEPTSQIRLVGKKQLRDYQHRAVLFSRARAGSHIGLPQGVGKTLCAVASGYDKMLRGIHDHVIVLCPATVKKNWMREVSSNLPAPFNSVAVVEDSDTEQIWHRPVKWHVMSLAKASIEIEQLSKIVHWWHKLLLIVDEGHFVSNNSRHVKGKGKQKVKRTASAQQIARWATGTILLTGQKIHKNERWYEMYQTIDPNFFHTQQNFFGRYITVSAGPFPEVIGNLNEEEIARKLPLLTLSYKKEDILPELPPLTFEDRWIDLNDVESKRYKQSIVAGLFEQDNRDTDRRGIIANPLTIMLNMRRYLDSPSLINSAWAKKSSKLSALKELLIGNEDKVVIFSQFSEMCKIIVEELGEENCFLYAENAPLDMWHEWLLQDEKKYFVMTTKGAAGIDLHGIMVERDGKHVWRAGAQTLIMYDELLDPGDNEQVHNRIHRLIDDASAMAKWSAHVITLRCSKTFEEHLYEELEAKTETAKRLMSGQISYAELKRWMMQKNSG
jgi:SNF2 family DNA or RNA helicase